MQLLGLNNYRRSKSSGTARAAAIVSAVALLLFTMAIVGEAQGPPPTATDPGFRGAPAGAGGFFTSGLNSYEQAVEPNLTFFITEVNNVAGGNSIKRVGLGARWDSNSCTSCHAQPNNGGSSVIPAGQINDQGNQSLGNPLFSVFQLLGGQNTMPTFETTNGPTIVARFPYMSDLTTPDGHVHQLFVITGRTDAGTCDIAQPDFAMAASQNNLIFRQTTPFFGGGLLEIIQDSDIIANWMSNMSGMGGVLGISGHPNYNADDGSINRFGWKAQKRSLMLFAGEAYNVEEGISNELFNNKLDETPGCTPPFPEGPPNGNGPHGVPDDRSDQANLPTSGYLYPGDPERFAAFGRFLAAPMPSTTCPGGGNCTDGQTQFNTVGCVFCHTTSFTTPTSSVGAALSNVTVNLFSDILVHDMGVCLADNISQGQAIGDEFRTAPLWGVGQRYFFLHDGRTSDIVQAVEDHYCGSSMQYGPSEANAVITNFNNLDQTAQQDLIDFLRSL